MKLLVLILNKTTYLEDILHKFHDIGVKGATVLDSTGVGRTIAEHNVSNFAIMHSLRKVIDGGRPYNKTIISVVSDDLVEPAFKGVAEVIGDLSQPGVGIMFAVPIDNVMGLPKAYY
ncbi:hypothetical protein IMX26_02145 [Clostridium sp. 'deep sea']|uniref:P-II family nitrogen regulator n=1 Tax=Clostridium sp. 'deep sea' TaxID=2779445 RepID=UPI0018966209|nr:P-II family nitrogen regulator [Clostridium sp. 'deep sea']QOR35652.1 hypothetical protein IMX26_02145 [Clostridium sp. 'deep sea']